MPLQGFTVIQYHRELFNKGYCFAEMVENTITTDINLHMHMKTGLRTVFVVPNVSLCFSRMQILDISNKNMEFPHFHLAFIWHTFIIVYPYFFQTLFIGILIMKNNTLQVMLFLSYF